MLKSFFVCIKLIAWRNFLREVLLKIDAEVNEKVLSLIFVAFCARHVSHADYIVSNC